MNPAFFQDHVFREILTRRKLTAANKGSKHAFGQETVISTPPLLHPGRAPGIEGGRSISPLDSRVEGRKVRSQIERVLRSPRQSPARVVPRLARRSESISLSKAAATLCNLLDKPAGSSWTPELQGYCQGLKDGYYPFPSPRPPQSALQSPRQLAVPFCPSVPPDHGQDSQNGHNPSPSPKVPRRSLQLPREPALHFVRQATAKTFSSEASRPEPGRYEKRARSWLPDSIRVLSRTARTLPPTGHPGLFDTTALPARRH